MLLNVCSVGAVFDANILERVFHGGNTEPFQLVAEGDLPARSNRAILPDTNPIPVILLCLRRIRIEIGVLCAVECRDMEESVVSNNRRARYSSCAS